MKGIEQNFMGIGYVLFLILLVLGLIVGGFLIFSYNKNKHCNFVAAYESTKNPNDSVEKQLNIYNGYLEVCRGSTFDYELWKLENNIPEN